MFPLFLVGLYSELLGDRGADEPRNGSWSPICLMLSMSSFTFSGSFARVLISGRRILLRGSSRIAGPPDLGFENGTPELKSIQEQA
ncbi:hypothetical protein MUK42_35427 [Musa troglodytarum]|uniref:Uncharacterized protein n=1 Tax=Musa troglodytarum TaxID=320322 RepID=A0A9E7EGV6_9LILI|nr:hypothetical protein MUK42_35427 [Musa troglodytarum]